MPDGTHQRCPGHSDWLAWAMAGASTALGALLARPYGWRAAARYATGALAASAVQHSALQALQRRTEVATLSPADVVTYSRATTGAILAGLLASGVRDRTGPAGWLGWGGTIVVVTLGDWLDGPLARHTGATALGPALDIETDSWLTFWSATAAVSWGGLPRWCLAPPILRYLLPLQALRAGRLPAGGGPWWWRVTGTAQMALIVAARAPARWRPPTRTERVAALLVSGAQSIAVLMMVWHEAARRRPSAR
ncbi:MAG: CDP-alcohol phosphatidyltransferase family protein [Thermomicrobiales bacterium]